MSVPRGRIGTVVVQDRRVPLHRVASTVVKLSHRPAIIAVHFPDDFAQEDLTVSAASVFAIGFIAGCLTGFVLRQRQRFRGTSAASD